MNIVRRHSDTERREWEQSPKIISGSPPAIVLEGGRLASYQPGASPQGIIRRRFRGLKARFISAANDRSGFQPLDRGGSVTWGDAPGWYTSGLRPEILAAGVNRAINVPHLIPARQRAIDRVAVAMAAACCLAIFSIPLLPPPVHAFSKQTRAAGAATFHDKGCEHCHGVDGIGTDRGPDLSTIGKRWKKDRIEKQIREGGGGMPPFGDALQQDEVKDLVDYLSAKRKSPATSRPSAVPQAPAADSGL